MKSQNLADRNLSNEQRPAPQRHRASRERRTAQAQLVISWALVAGMLIFIFVMSAQTGPQLDEGDGLFSQIKRSLAQQAFALTGHEVDVSPIGHFSEYFVLGFVLMNALRLHVKGNPFSHMSPRLPLLAMVLASLYGISDEFHQIFVPQRSCDPADWAVDTVAALIGALICYALVKRTIQG